MKIRLFFGKGIEKSFTIGTMTAATFAASSSKTTAGWAARSETVAVTTHRSSKWVTVPIYLGLSDYRNVLIISEGVPL